MLNDIESIKALIQKYENIVGKEDYAKMQGLLVQLDTKIVRSQLEYTDCLDNYKMISKAYKEEVTSHLPEITAESVRNFRERFCTPKV